MREYFVDGRKLPMLVRKGDELKVRDSANGGNMDLTVIGGGIFQSGELEGYEWFMAEVGGTGELVRIIID